MTEITELWRLILVDWARREEAAGGGDQGEVWVVEVWVVGTTSQKRCDVST